MIFAWYLWTKQVHLIQPLLWISSESYPVTECKQHNSNFYSYGRFHSFAILLEQFTQKDRRFYLVCDMLKNRLCRNVKMKFYTRKFNWNLLCCWIFGKNRTAILPFPWRIDVYLLKISINEKSKQRVFKMYLSILKENNQ